MYHCLFKIPSNDSILFCIVITVYLAPNSHQKLNTKFERTSTFIFLEHYLCCPLTKVFYSFYNNKLKQTHGYYFFSY